MDSSKDSQPQRRAFQNFEGRRVLVTGHTGFKGAWLSVWLHGLGAEVTGYSLPSDQKNGVFEAATVSSLLNGDYQADIRDSSALSRVVHETEPEVIFHLAAQPLVRESYVIPRETHETNYMGTCNLLEAVRTMGRPCAVVVVTTDKCYENQEQVWGYREIDRLGGHDPYSASKAAAELVVASYREAFFSVSELGKHGVGIATARAGNVIGGGDWAKDRIVPDMVRSCLDNRPVTIRNPHAVRPWQHVLEPLHGYLCIASLLLEGHAPSAASAWNFGPANEGLRTVGDLVSLFHKLWGAGEWHQDNFDQPHETSFLSLAIDKAINHLGWNPTWDFRTTISKTVDWYRTQDQGDISMLEYCRKDIKNFESLIKNGNSGVFSVLNAA
jgi:CDP-glucose 4,6-dehydratase